MSPSSLAPFWKTPDASEKVNCLCFGTGRFLRSVLVPALQEMGEDCYHPPALIQPRGSSFLEYMQQQQELGSYEVDTVLESGTVQTDRIPCSGAFSLGTEAAQAATWEFIASLQQPIRLIGVGVTEAGLASPDTQAMKDLMELLRQLAQKQFISSEDGADDDKICIVDMDNVPNNGDRIHSHLVDLAASDDNMQQFLQKHVVCLNTMVDRITSARPDSNGMVPRAEPLPAKALVVLDVDKVLPSTFGTVLGVVVRSSRTQLDADIALKLRIANGTHTAVAHALALQKMLMTDVLGLDKVVNSLWMESYLESVVHDQILTAAEPLYGKEESAACWDDWKKRLIHPHFGLSSFFITQNSASKAGIRWGPTVVNLLAGNKKVTVGTVFAYAALIRWLTPVRSSSDGRMVGWLDGAIPIETMGSEDDTDTTTSYADGLRYNLKEGWYEFKCSCILGEKTFSECLLKLARADAQPATYYDIFSVYLVAKDGGDLSTVSETSGFPVLVAAISTLVARMVAGDRLGDIMVEMQSFQGVFVDGFATDCQVLLDGSLTWAAEPHPTVLHFESSPVPDKSCLMQRVVGASSVESVIMSEVAAAEAIDLHTHLLPPTHGPLCSWGIDELLTYVSLLPLPLCHFVSPCCNQSHNSICSLLPALLSSRILYNGPSGYLSRRILQVDKTGPSRLDLEGSFRGQTTSLRSL
jgi:mannitol-1-phosphate/altronate dehydrogenase